MIYLITEPCNDDGERLKRTTSNFIDAFAALWPGSNFGPAHILIEDGNVDDDQIDFCIKSTQAELDGKGDSQERRSKAELLATLAFLDCLKQIPEDDR